MASKPGPSFRPLKGGSSHRPIFLVLPSVFPLEKFRMVQGTGCHQAPRLSHGHKASRTMLPRLSAPSGVSKSQRCGKFKFEHVSVGFVNILVFFSSNALQR